MTFIACAALLASAVAFTGCKGDQNAPQKQQEVVKTQFSIAMPSQVSNGARRMPSTSVLTQTSYFTGMKDVILIPFAKQGKITTSETRLSSNIRLAAFGGTELKAASSAKLYEDVSIPLNTSSFLFYAQANVEQTDTAKKFNVGVLDTIGITTGNPSDIQFTLVPIHSGTNYQTKGLADGTAGGKLLAYLNTIVVANDGATPTPKAWYEYTDGENAAMAAMFTTFSELKYLSSFGVSRMLTDLNRSLKPLAASSTLATNIRTAIANATYATVDANDSVILVSEIRKFPENISLPDGAISIKYVASSHTFTEGDYPNMTKPENFTYPASLWYFVNSTIKTSNTSKKTMYEGANDWDAILAAHTDPVSVNSKTRAVAIKDTVNFAVARLDVTVKLKNSSMADNSESATGIATAVDVSAGFPVKAVFVGGQQAVDYQFNSTAAGTEYTIYDKKMNDNDMIAKTAASTVNHTLVLASPAGSSSKVRIAVELQNEVRDFYGYDNQLIPLHGKFYVVAELNPAAATKTANQVFKQDYTTTANLTLKNLQSAYNTLPDLRTPQLELGFSVDLTWQAGNIYNVEFE